MQTNYEKLIIEKHMLILIFNIHVDGLVKWVR